MLKPNKHTDPDKTIVYTSTILLRRLMKMRVEGYAELRNHVEKKLGNTGRILFLPTLSFLFLLGLIEYHPKTDSIEYIGAS